MSLLSLGSTLAEVAPVTVDVPEPEAWTGQRLTFFVELKARGSFSGTATFSIPRIPQTVILNSGSPVVSSKQIEGEDWFIQRHQFDLFSQRTGPLEIPAFPVHFSAREGFTGPATEVSAEAPAIALSIRRPPGSEDLAYLITTTSFEVSETWQPQPGSAEVGAVFKRTITQRAGQMTGMALAPAPATAPAGIRLYPGKPEVTDQSERGEFHGERRETLTYLIEESGTLTVPALTYVWWDPRQQKLESKTLPAVTFEVPAPPPSPAAKASTRSRDLAFSLAALVVLAGIVWQRHRLATWIHRVWRKLNPPDRTAARQLLHACRRNDARGAAAAWTSWQKTRPPALKPTAALETAVLGLQRQLFGPSTPARWQGADLASSFSDFLKDPPAPTGRSSALPPLNP